jgi:hypothetical protein
MLLGRYRLLVRGFLRSLLLSAFSNQELIFQRLSTADNIAYGGLRLFTRRIGLSRLSHKKENTAAHLLREKSLALAGKPAPSKYWIQVL